MKIAEKLCPVWKMGNNDIEHVRFLKLGGFLNPDDTMYLAKTANLIFCTYQVF